MLPAAGQENGLRGPVFDSEVNRTLLSQAEGTDQPPPAPGREYQPISPGALPDADGDLFGDVATPSSQAADPFSPLDGEPARQPAVTAERAEQRAAEPAPAEAPSRTESTAVTLDDIRTGTARTATVDAEEALEFPRRMNEREAAIEGQEFEREENPYAPLGLRLGTFVVVPTLEQGITWTSNANDSPDGEEAVLSESTLRLNATSDWSRHRATINAFGTIRKTLSGQEIKEIEGGGDANLELDIAHGLVGRASLGYSVGREGASSPVSIVGVEEQPLRHTIDGSVGLEKTLGPLRLGLTGEVSRDQFGDAELIGGGTLSQSDRNSTLALLRLRAGYEISPAFMPFVELEGGRRFYDEDRDSAGYARSADRLGASAGVALDLSEKLSGEVSAGWISEDFEDERLRSISGVALAASLDWSPVRGTLVGLDASTTVEGSTDPGESGSLLYSGTLRIERQMRSNLTGDLAFGAAYRDYEAGGHDLILNGEAALTWWLNRYTGLVGRASYERQTSSLPDRDYETTSFFMGVRMQR